MNHPSLENWLDYARGLTGPAEAAVMQQHLGACTRCSDQHAWLERCLRLAALDRGLDVPPELVENARRLFQTPDARGWLVKLRDLVAELVRESSLEFVPGGTRGHSPGLQLQYRAGPYAVELMMNQPGAQDEIVGQVANTENTGERLAGALVEVVSGKSAISATETNQFGEFIIGRPSQKDCALQIALPDAGVRIVIALKKKTVD